MLRDEYGDWADVISEGRFQSALEHRRAEVDEVLTGEVRDWRMGVVNTPAARAASLLRGRFGVRTPSAANVLMGEAWLLEKWSEVDGKRSALSVGDSERASTAVTLWLTPTVVDEALSVPHFRRGC